MAGQILTSTRSGEKGPIVTTYEYDANGRLVYTEGPRGDEEDQEEEGKPEGTDEASSGNGGPSSNGKGAGKGSSTSPAEGLDPSKVGKIGRVVGNVFRRAGGGVEVTYVGTVATEFLEKVK